MKCNHGLGIFKDNVIIIQAAKSYLEAGGIPEIKAILTPIHPQPSVTPTFLTVSVA
jgi:hypothetical protein